MGGSGHVLAPGSFQRGLMHRTVTATVGILMWSLVGRAGGEPVATVSAWASGPFEVRVAFDRPPPQGVAARMVGARIVFGDGVKAGERYRPRNPGDPPPKQTRGSLRIASSRIDADGRTLVLSTDPHPVDASYALTIPDLAHGDVAYSLKGIDAVWDSGKDGDPPEGSGWWPSASWAEVQKTLAASAPLESMRNRFAKPGRLSLKTVVALPKGKAAIRASASVAFEVALGNESAKSRPDAKGSHSAEVAGIVEDGVPGLDLVVVANLDGNAPFGFEATFADGRPLPSSSLTLPWAPPKPLSLPPASVPAAILTGGDPIKGAAIYKGEQAKCATCHKIRGEGGEVGPDLSDLVHRDRIDVYRQIAEPSATIHPDYLSYTLILKDGRVLVGIVRAEGADSVKVVDTEAKATLVKKAEIEDLKPSATSIMPVGLLGAVGDAGVKDLLAYLTGK